MPDTTTAPTAGPNDLLEALRSILAAARESSTGLADASRSANYKTQVANLRVYNMGATLKDVIVRDPRFLGDVVRMVASPNGKSGFYPNFLGQQMVQRLLESDSPEKTIQWLLKVLHTSEADGHMITLLRGVSVAARVQLTPRLVLVPLNELPDSPQKRRMARVEHHFDLPVRELLEWEPPSAALVLSYRAHPFLVGAGNSLPDQYIADCEFVADAILALTLVGPRIAMRVADWFNFADPDLDAAQLAHSFGVSSVEVVPNQPLDTFPPFDVERAREVVDSFVKLEGRVKDKVRIALTRLKLALSRRSVGDKALEVAIAFEALLEDGSRNEMTHKITVRTAQLIGGPQEVRERNAAIVKKLYDVRSGLVHTGHVDASKPIRLRPGESKVPVDEVVALAIDLCADLIWIILRRRKIPNWPIFDVAESENAA